MLAGHTHGGQVCVPLVSPVFCPSRHGVEMTSGVFHSQPALIHVTGGISKRIPVTLELPTRSPLLNPTPRPPGLDAPIHTPRPASLAVSRVA
jgi:hypothetical protein